MGTAMRSAIWAGVAALATACGQSDLREAIVGSWGSEGEEDRFTFAADGGLLFGNRFLTLDGQYRLSEEGVVEMSLRDPFGGAVERMRFRASVKEDGLELCPPPEAPGGSCNFWPRAQE